MTAATPSHAKLRPFAASRVIVGALSLLLSLAFNIVVFLVAAYGSTAAVTTMGVELVIAVTLAVWFAQRHDSRAANIAFSFCIGVAGGVTPFLLWLAVAALLTR